MPQNDLVPEPNAPMAELCEQARMLFVATFSREPDGFAAAPGRVNLIGEHIDYCDGFVLPFAIERAIVMAWSRLEEPVARLVSAGGDGKVVEIPTGSRPEKGEPAWANYVRGVLDGFFERGADTLDGFSAAVVTSIPAGAGLSSSAALEMVFAVLVDALNGGGTSPTELALLSQRAEHLFAGMPCGIMDQFASALGREDHFLLIDCRSQEVESIPFKDPELSLLVVDSAVKHALVDGDYAKRRASTERALAVLGKESWREVSLGAVEAAAGQLGEEDFRRARHVVTEIERTVAAVECLREGRMSQLGQYMYASHASLRDDFEVSCAELDTLVEIFASIGVEGGVLGARMTGGGFGGSAIALCETDKVAAIAHEMRRRYREATGKDGRIFATRPAAGARMLAIEEVRHA